MNPVLAEGSTRKTMSDVNLDVGLGRQSEPAIARSPDDPFRIVLLGDFGGRASRQAPRTRREPLLIDPDNFESVMERLETGLLLSTGSAELTIPFRELDDFHPDHLYSSLPLFQSLRRTRGELANPATFRATATRLSPDPAAPPPPAPVAFSGSLLDQIAEQSEGAPVPVRDNRTSWDEVIRRVVQPHIIPGPDPRQPGLLGQVDAATSELMRAVLAHPQFQALESAWRSLFFLLQRLETGVELKLYVLDLTREELVEAAAAGRPLVKEGWSVAACLHPFLPNQADCATLANLAKLGRQAGGPVLASIHPRLLGCESIGATPDPDDWKQPLDDASALAWRELRRHPDARWLGLILPRCLLRLPYGAKTSPCEAFDFEEMPHPPDHEAYLWGNPAVACACLLGQAFNLRGWRLHPGLVNRLDGLPVHSFRCERRTHHDPARRDTVDRP